MGAHSTYTEEKAAQIVARITAGEPMAVICRDDDMPSVSSVHRWLDAHEDFAASIARAREFGYDAIAAECLSIADQPNKRITEDGQAVESDPNRDRLRVDTRLKLLAKWDPKRYGDKQQVEHSADKATLEAIIAASVGKLSTE